MKKLFVMTGGKYGFAYDFYQYVLSQMGFDLYHLDFNMRLPQLRYYLRLFWKKYGLVWASGSERGMLTVLARHLPMLKGKLSETRLITRFHGCFGTRMDGWKPLVSLFGSDHVVWVYDCWNRLKKRFPMFSKNRFSVVHNGVDLTLYRSGSNRSDNMIFTLSNWWKHKRLHLLLQAMTFLPEHHLYIGGFFINMEYKQQCLRLIQRRKDQVTWLGLVTVDKVKWMNKASVFVLPSVDESWSTHTMEAMACECPVLITKSGGTPEYVPKLELLPKRITLEHLAERIKQVSSNRELGKLNRERVKPYSWNHIKPEVERVLNCLEVPA